MSIIAFFICFILYISIIGYLKLNKDEYKQTHFNEYKLNTYDKLNPYDIYKKPYGKLSPCDIYKLFVGQNKNGDYQQRGKGYDYMWQSYYKYKLTSSKKYIFTNIVLCIAMAIMIIHYAFLVMDGVAILKGGYQYIPLLISVVICTNKLIYKYKAYKIAKAILKIYDNMLPQIIEGKRVNLSFKYLGEYVTLDFKLVPYSSVRMIDEKPYKDGKVDIFIAINNNETQATLYILWKIHRAYR